MHVYSDWHMVTFLSCFQYNSNKVEHFIVDSRLLEGMVMLSFPSQLVLYKADEQGYKNDKLNSTPSSEGFIQSGQ